MAVYETSFEVNVQFPPPHCCATVEEIGAERISVLPYKTMFLIYLLAATLTLCSANLVLTSQLILNQTKYDVKS